MKSLLTSALMLAFLAAPVVASEDEPSCPGCPKKGDKAEPSALVLGCDCAKCECKDCKGDCCGKKKPAAPAQDDCDKGCDKGKKKDCDKDDCSATQDDCEGCPGKKDKDGEKSCSDVTACDTCDTHKSKEGEKPAAPAQDDCDKGCDKGKKKDCDKDDCSASQEDCGGCKKGKKKGGCDKEEAPASA